MEVEAWQERTATSVACGGDHTAVILDDGTLHTFGDGEYGRLGHGDWQDQASPKRVEVGSAFVTGITFSATHAAAWTRDGRVFCWGADAAHGQLGPGGAEPAAPRGSTALLPQEVTVLPGSGWRCGRGCQGADAIAGVALGSDHNTYAHTARGKVFAWGRGVGGQLGLGATERDHDSPRRMGVAQGRNVTGVFVTLDGHVWLSCAPRAARGERAAGGGSGHGIDSGGSQDQAADPDLEDPKPGRTAAGGSIRNPLQLREDTLDILRQAEAGKSHQSQI